MKTILLGSAIGAVLCSGCATMPSGSDRRPAASGLPQLVRYFSVAKVRLKPGALFISGEGSAAADGGKYSYTRKSPLSSYPIIELTIKSDNAGELESCRQQVQDAQDNHHTVDIRGMGTYTIESEIDPPLETGVLKLTQLDACGATLSPAVVPPTAVSTPAISAAAASTAAIPAALAAVPAADLVAVPERYLDRRSTITAHLVAPVHFGDPVSNLTLESEGQSLPCYFLTESLPGEARLSLVHAAPDSALVLEGTLTRIKPGSLAVQSGANAAGYEFDVSKVVSIESASH